MQNMRRQGVYGHVGGFLNHNTTLLVFSLIAVFVTLVFSRAARAQTGVGSFSQSADHGSASQSVTPINIVFTGTTDTTATVDFMTIDGTAMAAAYGSGRPEYASPSRQRPYHRRDQRCGQHCVVEQRPAVFHVNRGTFALLNPTGSVVLQTQSTATLTIINDEEERLQFAQPTFSVDDTGQWSATIMLVQ